MSKIIFTNKFSESLAALLKAYDNGTIHLSYELMVDVRIEKIEIDTAIASGIMWEGGRTTTGMKRFV